MKTLFIISLLLIKTAIAADITYVSERLAEDILKTRGQTRAADTVGRWKKVLHGPSKDTVGRIDYRGIVEGAQESITTLTISSSSLSGWLPQEVSTVYAARLENIFVPFVNSKYIPVKPEIVNLAKNHAISQVDDSITFEVNFSYKYTYGETVRSHDYILGGYFSVDTSSWKQTEHDYDLRISYFCSLQDGNRNRLICSQKILEKTDTNGVGGYIAYNLDFPELIAFERE